jgi:uncharacterized protein
VKCLDVYHLLAGLENAPADATMVELSGVDHMLKEDASLTTAGYGRPLPFSSRLDQALRTFGNRLR